VTPTGTPSATTPPPTLAAPAPAQKPIAFVSKQRDGNHQIYVMSDNGSNQTRLTTTGSYNSDPAWSPDETRLAFVSYRDGNYEIYTMNADESGSKRLTNNPAADINPKWSPDGTRIAFVSNREGGFYLIFVMNADGLGVKALMATHSSVPNENSPTWSPDGKHIAFSSDTDIYVVNADGSNRVRLTNNTQSTSLGRVPSFSELAWSPDGQHIASSYNRDGNDEIYVINADGSGLKRLTNNPASDQYPAWSPDSKRIAFASNRDGNYEIYVMNADGTGLNHLTNNSADDILPAWAPSQPGSPSTQVRERDGAETFSVPAGEFTMGSDSGEASEKPVHRVYLDSFWIDRTEVTNGQYTHCVTAGKCNPSRSADNSKVNGENQPVVSVAWDDAKAYCEWAGARLPTEAEWEKAARGSDGRKWPWGNSPATCDYSVLDAGDGRGCGRDTTWPVGSKTSGASPYGALDMAGNVWEWVADWYDATYYSRSPARNPTGPESGTLRVLRGGSWRDLSYGVRTTIRNYGNPGATGVYFGFRCAQD